MLNSLLFLGLPLLLFVILDSMGGLKVGLVGAIIASFAELAFSYHTLGEIDWTSIVSIVLVLGLAALSLWKKTSLHFKLQPAVLSFIIAALFLGSYILGKPFLFEMIVKYRSVLSSQQQMILNNPSTPYFFGLATGYGGISFLFHGFFMIWVALKKSNWFWLISRGVGTFVASGLSVLLAAIHLKYLGLSF